LIEGAFDFVLKPSGMNPAENKATLLAALEEKIAGLRDAAVDVPEMAPPMASSVPAVPRAGRVEAVIIGCSTGGPDALARIIPDLPADLPVPVFVVQHMPEGFTASLAARLNEASELEVLEVTDGMTVNSGQVVIARGGRHLHLDRQTSHGVVVSLTDAPPEHRCRPAVDYTLRSAAQVFQGGLLVVILTGMGRDGTAGCRLVRDHGGSILAQHTDGCTVYGMPKSVIAAGLSDLVIRLPQIASTIEQIVRKTAIP
jgi:two-component system chemotaxis response regulator CheB